MDRYTTLSPIEVDRRSKEDYVRRSKGWREEQKEIEAKLAQIRVADDSYLDTGLQVLELSKNAARIYESLTLPEKRELLSFVCSNSFGRTKRLPSLTEIPLRSLCNSLKLEKPLPTLWGSKTAFLRYGWQTRNRT